MMKDESRETKNKPYALKSLLNSIAAETEVKIAIKTALAAAFSLVIGSALAEKLERPDIFISGLWCVMAAVVVIQAHVGGTYQAGWVRFLGVFVGSIAGALFIHLLGSGPFSLAISIFFTIVLCALLNIKDSFRIAGLSVAVIIMMGNSHPSVNPWLFSFYRFLDSCIGILVALAITHLVWPEKAIENIRKNSAKTLNLLGRYFTLAVELDPESEQHAVLAQTLCREISYLLEENREMRKEAAIELFDDPFLKEQWLSLSNDLDVLFEDIDTLKNVHKDTISKILDDSLANKFLDVSDKIITAFQSLEKKGNGEKLDSDLSELKEGLSELSAELIRFRETRKTRKFNLEDVENFFVFFYSLRSIGEKLLKTNLLMHQFVQQNQF